MTNRQYVRYEVRIADRNSPNTYRVLPPKPDIINDEQDYLCYDPTSEESAVGFADRVMAEYAVQLWVVRLDIKETVVRSP